MKFLPLHLALALVLFVPTITNAQAGGPPAMVLLSEIAWMGTDESATNEWIEIYNLSGSSTDITGWKIESADGNISITLKCTLTPHGVAVLERTDEGTLPSSEALLTYTGELVNSGTTLVLRNASGVEVDRAVGGTDWLDIGGSNTVPKKTAQRTRENTWVTATATPMGQRTAGELGSTPNVTCPPPEEVNEEENSNTTATVTQRSGGGGGSAKRSSGNNAPKPPPPELALSVKGPKTAYVNQEVTFEAVPSGVGKTIERSLSYDWNFGDTYTGKGKSGKHVFEYPGEYIVVAQGAFAKQEAMARHEVKVLPVSFTLSRNAKGDIEMKNNANYETDLGGFTLRGGSAPFTFPKYTFVKGNGTLVVPGKRIGSAPSLALYDTQGTSVFALGASAPAFRPQVATVQAQETVTDTPASDAPVARAEDTVIRIGENSGMSEPRGPLTRLWYRISRIFGS